MCAKEKQYTGHGILLAAAFLCHTRYNTENARKPMEMGRLGNFPREGGGSPDRDRGVRQGEEGKKRTTITRRCTAAKHTPTGVHDPAVDAAFCKCREEVEAALLRCAPQQDWMRGPEMEDLICDVRARCVWFCCPMGCGVMSYCAAVVGCGRSSCSAQTPP